MVYNSDMRKAAFWAYFSVDYATFIYLAFFSGWSTEWWHHFAWLLPQIFLAQLWPLYWSVIHWLV